MSGDWNTKYGTRRVRHDPPTLEEAIFAAIGITDDVEAQAEIASSLMGLPYDEVLAEVKKTARVSARTGTAINSTAVQTSEIQRFICIMAKTSFALASNRRRSKASTNQATAATGSATLLSVLNW